MALSVKNIDDWKPQIDGLIGKYGGGGGGGLNLGAIVGGALAAGTTAAIASGGSISGNKGGGGGIAALPKNPIDGNLPLIESETAGTPTPEPKPEEQKEPIMIPSEPTIKDETETNIENPVNSVDMMAWLEEQQKKQWEREDTIRKETQEREDNAYQRAVEDMRKAGINPNLMNVQAATSGGGITQATGINYQPYQIEMDKYISLLEQEIDNAFKEDENGKDRFMDIFGNLLQSVIMAVLLKR